MAPAFDLPAPFVIAHRGASALLPEHTLAAYARAIADGADVIEPDLVCTRDGVLVARHEAEIGGTTDVAQRPEFAGRRTTRSIDGHAVEGWFTVDFTHAELRTLRARERLPHLRSTGHDGVFPIPTLDEIIVLVAAASATSGRRLGLMPEVKAPSWFRAQGLALEERLLERLDAHDYTRTAPVVVQSFEVGNLRALRERIAGRANVRLMQLLGAPDRRPVDGEATYGRMLAPDGLRDIAGYAHLIGVPARAVVPVDADGRLAAPTTIVADAHAAALQVATYTHRPENHYLPRALWDGEDPRTVNIAGSIAEIHAVLAAGVDGFFADHPAIGCEAVRRFGEGGR
jgi:glycerophosphoryl diester phosphodiesterase